MHLQILCTYLPCVFSTSPIRALLTLLFYYIPFLATTISYPYPLFFFIIHSLPTLSNSFHLFYPLTFSFFSLSLSLLSKHINLIFIIFFHFYSIFLIINLFPLSLSITLISSPYFYLFLFILFYSYSLFYLFYIFYSLTFFPHPFLLIHSPFFSLLIQCISIFLHFIKLSFSPLYSLLPISAICSYTFHSSTLTLISTFPFHFYYLSLNSYHLH